MLKRCLSPLTLVNQVALIVLLSTAIGLAGMAVSGWLVQGVQGSAHAINKAGSLRMQSYRLLAAVPLSEKDKPLIKEMEQTAFSAELTRAAERDGQLAQLQGLQDYWRNELIPALMRAQNRETVSADVSQFVAGLDQLVSGFDRTTEMRIETVVLVHRVMAVFMALLLVFTIIWLRARLLQPWRQLLAMASAVSHRDFTQRAAVPLSEKDKPLIKEMEQTAFSAELTRAAERDGQLAQLQGLQDYWRNELIPALMRAQNRETVSADVSQFVAGLDQLVSGFDRTTEMRIETVVLVHRVMAVFMALLLVFTIIWLRARLLQPWRQLLAMASAVSHRDFTQRANISGRNEMAMLGTALNNMSAELAESYAVLEQRVQEKTAGLEHKNQILSFLWQANRRLHSRAPLCERLSPVLNGLQNLTLLRDIELRVYDTDDEENHQEFTCQPDMTCDDKGCQLCPRGVLPVGDRGTTLKWRLADTHTQYGILLATLPQGRHLSHDQQQLVDTLVEQLTATLALDRHQERQQQLIVMEERATIARELHDSIAQSLSCMKMQVSCLQMQGDALPESSRELLSQIRNELNASWVQLRELLTTFRLQLTEPGLRPALEASCEEYSAKFGFPVKLDYQLPPRLVPSHQAIHLLQIAREALSNALKHSQASEVVVTVAQNDNQVKLTVQDNGCGVPENAIRSNHYGMIIMRDRAQSLRGDCRVRRRESGGTEVVVTFIPEKTFTDVQGDTHE